MVPACLLATLLGIAACPALAAADRPDIQYYRLAQGFQREAIGLTGFASGTGFATANRWGQYTAYLMATNAAGQRTWRIEHYLPRPGQGWAEGSTIYLLEGSRRALMIDTGNPASFTPGVDDLKTIAHYLLGHESDGRPKARPLDFVVTNTHNHADHIGENVLMADRTVYYPDLDWPDAAPANYVPIREGGGATAHGKGRAVAEIDLGGRVLKAIAVPPHSTGSTAYLDAGNRMIFTGDAIGSGFPFIQRGPFVAYDRTIHHLEEVTRPFPDIAVMPAHSYQIDAWSRMGPPLNGRPLDRRYILDQATLADGILDGMIEGGPFVTGHDAMWARHGSAQACYTLDHLAAAGQALPGNYHAVRIPGDFRREWTSILTLSQDIDEIADIRVDFHLIRDADGNTLFLLKGSAGALLIGTGGGGTGLAAFVTRLTGGAPLDVALLDGSHGQTGGLAQLSPRHVYVGANASKPPVGAIVLHDGDTIDLGKDGDGRPLRLQADTMLAALTLREESERLMSAGTVLGRQGEALQIDDPAAYQVALTIWASRTTGRYDRLYLSGSADWYLSPVYVAELKRVLSQAHTGKGDAIADTTAVPDKTLYRSSGDKDVRAEILVPK